MRKLEHLRAHLVGACPRLQRDPDQLLTFAEDGRVRCHLGEDLTHAYRYTAQIVLTDYSGAVDDVLLPLLDWLAVYEPETRPDEAVRFEAEILRHDAVDLSLRVDLSERVVVTRAADGTLTADHRLDPRAFGAYGPAGWELTATDQYDGD